MPTCWIIAGPNGAGKTTFAMEYLPNIVRCLHFINADLIAAGLSPFAPEQELIAASRIFLNEIEERIAKRQDFAFETTLAGRSYLRLINRLKKEGWSVELIYLALPSAEMSKLRVAERVKHGGHNIPADDIERRFPRSLSNLLTEFSHKVDRCLCFMNDGESPVLVFEQNGTARDIIHQDYQTATGGDIMTESYKKSPSREGQIILDTLQEAVNKALDKKRRLGQYAVVWKDGAPIITDNRTTQETSSK